MGFGGALEPLAGMARAPQPGADTRPCRAHTHSVRDSARDEPVWHPCGQRRPQLRPLRSAAHPFRRCAPIQALRNTARQRARGSCAQRCGAAESGAWTAVRLRFNHAAPQADLAPRAIFTGCVKTRNPASEVTQAAALHSPRGAVKPLAAPRLLSHHGRRRRAASLQSRLRGPPYRRTRRRSSCRGVRSYAGSARAQAARAHTCRLSESHSEGPPKGTEGLGEPWGSAPGPDLPYNTRIIRRAVYTRIIPVYYRGVSRI